MSKSKIDTSIKGYEYIGIKLNEEQLNRLSIINTMMIGDTGKVIPVHCVLLVLKALGLLPSEMVYDVSSNDSNNDSADNSENICDESFQKFYGKIKS